MAYKQRVVTNGRRKTKKKTANKRRSTKKKATKRNAKKTRRPAAKKKANRKKPRKAAKKKANKKVAKKRNVKKKTKRKSNKKPSAKQLANRARFTKMVKAKAAAKKKRNPATAATYAHAKAGGKRMAGSGVGSGGRIMPAGGAIARTIAKELADVKRAIAEGEKRCKKTEAALTDDLASAKRHLKTARGQLTKARNKIKSLQTMVGDMKAAQVKALRAAQKRTAALGTEAVRLGKLVQYYTYKGERLKRKGGKSLVKSKTRTKKGICGPDGRVSAKRASASAKKVRAGSGAVRGKTEAPTPGGAGSGLAYKRWCAGVKRNFNDYKKPF